MPFAAEKINVLHLGQTGPGRVYYIERQRIEPVDQIRDLAQMVEANELELHLFTTLQDEVTEEGSDTCSSSDNLGLFAGPKGMNGVFVWDTDERTLRKKPLTKAGTTSRIKSDLERMNFHEILGELKQSRFYLLRNQTYKIQITTEKYEVSVWEVLDALDSSFERWYHDEISENELRNEFLMSEESNEILIEGRASKMEKCSAHFRWLLLIAVVVGFLTLATGTIAYMHSFQPTVKELNYTTSSHSLPAAASYQLNPHPKGVIVTYPNNSWYTHVVFNTSLVQMESLTDNNEMPVALTKVFKNVTGYYYVNNGVVLYLGEHVHEVSMLEEHYPLFLEVDEGDSAQLDIPWASPNPQFVKFKTPVPGVKDAIFSTGDGNLLYVIDGRVYRQGAVVRDGEFQITQEAVEYQNIEKCSSSVSCDYEFVRLRAVLYGIISYPKAGPGRLTVQFFERVDDTGYRINLLVHSTPTIVYNGPEKELMICQINKSILECRTYPMQIVYDWPSGNPA